MTYEMLIGALGLIALLIGIIKPIIDLNKNIATLTISVNQLKEILDEVKDRVSIHGAEIDNINVTLADHEVRIKTLEK